MSASLEPNKTKIARRVFEIFEFFGDSGQNVTVMDIVRRYGRPQSSTSELLSSLVDMGLLYKDPRSRSYTPTPRIAALGASAQPEIIRDGGLFTLMDRLAASTGMGVALFGMVGTHVQIFRFSTGSDPTMQKLTCGASEKLFASAAGLLLLSTFAPDPADRMLWRLHAEAEVAEKFNLIEAKARLVEIRKRRHAVGNVGFIPGAQVAATLLPRSYIRRPLALGIIFPVAEKVDVLSLIGTMNEEITECTVPKGKRYSTTINKPYKIAV